MRTSEEAELPETLECPAQDRIGPAPAARRKDLMPSNGTPSSGRVSAMHESGRSSRQPNNPEIRSRRFETLNGPHDLRAIHCGYFASSELQSLTLLAAPRDVQLSRSFEKTRRRDRSSFRPSLAQTFFSRPEPVKVIGDIGVLSRILSRRRVVLHPSGVHAGRRFFSHL